LAIPSYIGAIVSKVTANSVTVHHVNYPDPAVGVMPKSWGPAD